MDAAEQYTLHQLVCVGGGGGGGGGGADDQTPEVNIVKKIYILLNMYFKKWSSHCCETVV